MKIKLIFIFSVFLTFSACGKKYKITPDTLPTAHVNQFYHKIINISGGKVIDKDNPLKTDIPRDLGITIQPKNELDGYNIIEIKGTSKYTGKFEINISAGFYGGGSAEIDRIYVLTVRN